MKIFLTNKGFASLLGLAKEAGTTPSEVVEHLVLAYERVPIEERDKAEYKCEWCSHSYFAPANLASHIKAVHTKQNEVKNEAR